jgi:hypothetical protein
MSQAGHRNQRKAPAVEWMPRICDRDLFRPSIPRPSRGIKKWDRKASAGSDRSSFGKVRKIIDYGHIGQRDNDDGAVIKRRAAAPPRIHIGTWRSSSAASSTSLLNGVDVTIVPVFARRPGATSSSSAQLHSSAVEQQGYWPAPSGLAAPLSEFRIAGSVWNDSAPADPAPSSRARGQSVPRPAVAADGIWS